MSRVDIVGDWDVAIKTPIGSLRITYAFTEHDGILGGHATSSSETVPLTDFIVTEDVEGQRFCWKQRVTKPMRLNLEFDVQVDGDHLIGHSRAGRFAPLGRVGRAAHLNATRSGGALAEGLPIATRRHPR